jgi:hypothetical protein
MSRLDPLSQLLPYKHPYRHRLELFFLVLYDFVEEFEFAFLSLDYTFPNLHFLTEMCYFLLRLIPLLA